MESEGDRGPWGKFKTEGEWELVKWLLQNIGHTQILKYLELPIVRCLTHSSIQNISKHQSDQGEANANVL
jgi:hypothetical protein